MEIRPATPADARVIAEVHVSSWQAAYVGQVPQDFLDGLSVETRELAWRDLLATTSWPETGALVLVGDDLVMGFCHVGASRDEDSADLTGEVTAIYLRPEAWSAGWGRRLMEEALSRLREASFREATLWVLETNDRARRFYEAGGWRHDGTIKIDDRGTFVLRELRYRLSLI